MYKKLWRNSRSNGIVFMKRYKSRAVAFSAENPEFTGMGIESEVPVYLSKGK
jgi:hypothetical protein